MVGLARRIKGGEAGVLGGNPKGGKRVKSFKKIAVRGPGYKVIKKSQFLNFEKRSYGFGTPLFEGSSFLKKGKNLAGVLGPFGFRGEKVAYGFWKIYPNFWGNPNVPPFKF